MDNNSSLIMQAVQFVKEQAKNAEDKYDSAADLIELKSQTSIDLFGGNATSKVVELASMARKACDELYVAYQSLVVILDSKCRPLVDESTSGNDLNEVYQMIAWLNSESEISNNFTASLNGAGLGEIASRQYIPSIENKMIEKFWEIKLNERPDAEEIKHAYFQRKMEETKQKHQAELEAKRALRELEKQLQEEQKQQEKNIVAQRGIDQQEKAQQLKQARDRVEFAKNLISGCFSAIALVKPDGTVSIKEQYFKPFKENVEPGNVSHFTNIKQIVCTNDGVVGLRDDGTCVSTNPGKSCDAHITEANSWTNVVKLAAGAHHVVGLRSDGTCIATSIKWNVSYGYNGQSDVADWSDIVDIYCGDYFTVGLKKDGTLIHVGRDCSNVANWKDIELLGVGNENVIGLKTNGEIVTCGKVNYAAMSHAKDFVQLHLIGQMAYALEANGDVVGGKYDSILENHHSVISSNVECLAGTVELLSLNRDGSITRRGSRGIYPPSKEFDSLEAFKEEKEKAQEKKKQEEALKRQRRASGLCQHCGGSFKKMLLINKCTSCSKLKDY